MLLLLFSKSIRRFLAAVLLTAVGIAVWVAGQVWWTARQDHQPRSDAIVVLGASQYNGRPSEVFQARLDHAKSLYDAGVAPRIVTVGGGAPGDRTTEAQAGADYLHKHGVARVVVVPEGRDTLQSLQAMRTELTRRDWDSVVLVTDPWHSFRSLRMARDLGLRAETSPTRSGPTVASRTTEVRYVARETAAYLSYRAFSR